MRNNLLQIEVGSFHYFVEELGEKLIILIICNRNIANRTCFSLSWHSEHNEEVGEQKIERGEKSLNRGEVEENSLAHATAPSPESVSLSGEFENCPWHQKSVLGSQTLRFWRVAEWQDIDGFIEIHVFWFLWLHKSKNLHCWAVEAKMASRDGVPEPAVLTPRT